MVPPSWSHGKSVPPPTCGGGSELGTRATASPSSFPETSPRFLLGSRHRHADPNPGAPDPGMGLRCVPGRVAGLRNPTGAGVPQTRCAGAGQAACWWFSAALAPKGPGRGLVEHQSPRLLPGGEPRPCSGPSAGPAPQTARGTEAPPAVPAGRGRGGRAEPHPRPAGEGARRACRPRKGLGDVIPERGKNRICLAGSGQLARRTDTGERGGHCLPTPAGPLPPILVSQARGAQDCTPPHPAPAPNMELSMVSGPAGRLLCHLFPSQGGYYSSRWRGHGGRGGGAVQDNSTPLPICARRNLRLWLPAPQASTGRPRTTAPTS